MPVNKTANLGAASTHPEYSEFYSRWLAINDAMKGEVVVKNKGKVYLPELSGQTYNEYDRYKRGAKWYNAPFLTVAGLTGMVLRKPSVVELSEDIIKLLDNITLTGISLDSFCGEIISDTLTYGRVGALVDFSETEQLPYMVSYNALDILNWNTKDNKLDMVVLRETYYETGENEFDLRLSVRYRVLSLIEGIYTIRVYQESVNQTPELVETIIPSIKGSTLDFIPFYFFSSGQYGQYGTSISDSPIESIINLSYHYYLVSADYNWGLHWIALPTPYVTGVTEETIPNTLGPHQVWGLPTGSTCGLLEYIGSGLGELREALETDKREMADSGARLLETRAHAAEAAKTVEMKQTSDASILSGIVSKINMGMNNLLKWYVEWLGKNSDTVSIQINKDFVPDDIDPLLLNSLITALQAGEISRIEFFKQLQKGEIIEGDKTFEEHEQELEEDASKRAIVMQNDLQMQQDIFNNNDNNNNDASNSK